MRYLKLWIILGLVIVGSFVVLGYYGMRIYQEAPPIPQRVVTADGEVLFTGEDIRDGQNVWQSMGGQEVGSIWGHGAYVAPDWNADWLHRESVWLLDRWAVQEHGERFADLDAGQQAVLRQRLLREMRTNTYDASSDELTISADRAAAYAALSGYYAALFGDAQEFSENIRDYADADMAPQQLRDAYAVARNSITDPQRQADMNAFFFWSTWATTTERPVDETHEISGVPVAQNITYTNKWPAEELVGNRPTGEIVVWSVISFVVLLAGIGALAWYYAVLGYSDEGEHELPADDPLLAMRPTPSMKATLKYFWVVMALIVVQVGLIRNPGRCCTPLSSSG